MKTKPYFTLSLLIIIFLMPHLSWSAIIENGSSSKTTLDPQHNISHQALEFSMGRVPENFLDDISLSPFFSILQLIQQQKYSEAHKKIHRIQQEKPKNLYVLYALDGLVFTEEKKLHDAEQAYLKALELQPNNPHLYATLAELYLQQSQRLKAEKAAFAALEIDKNHPKALIILAKLHQDAGNFNKTAELYQYAIRSARTQWQDSLPAINEFARFLNQIGEFGSTYDLLHPELINRTKITQKSELLAFILFAEAGLKTQHLDSVKRSIELLKSVLPEENAELLIIHARYLFQSGQKDQAFKFLTQALNSNQPNQSAIIFTLYNLYKEEKQVENAASLLEKAIPQETDLHMRSILLSDLSNYLLLNSLNQRAIDFSREQFENFPDDLQIGFIYASVLNYNKDYQAALKVINRLLKQEKNFAEAYALKGKIYKQLKQHQLAESALRKAVEIEPKRVKDWINLAYLAHDTQGHEGLIKIIEEGLTHNPGNIDLKIEIAAVHNEEGHFQKANSIYKQILDRHPKNISVLILYSMNLAILGDSDSALKLAERAQKLAPKSAFVNANYGRILYLTGHASKSIELLKVAEQELPKSGQLHYWLAETYVSLSENKKAARSLALAFKFGLNTSDKKKAKLLLAQLSHMEN